MTSQIDWIQQVKIFCSVSQEDLKSQVILKKKQNTFFLLLNRKANTFNKTFLREINKKLDEVQNNQGPTALVTISLQKIFSAGMDLKFISSLDIRDARYFVLEFIALFARLSVFPVPTIALVKGVAMAGGCMFSFSHDSIFVIDEAQFSCNQVQMGLPLPPGMFAVIKKRHHSHASLRDMCIFGKKFKSKQALQYGLIDAIYNSQKDPKLIQKLFEQSQKLSKFGQNKANFKKLKQEMYKDVVDNAMNRQHANGVKGEPDQNLLIPKL